MKLTKRQQALVEKHLALVAPIAKRVGSQLPKSILVDDLIQEGHMGLMQAAQRFDPKKGIPFGTYARYRIRGSIIDAFRRRNYHYELHDDVGPALADISDEDRKLDWTPHMNRLVRHITDTAPNPEERMGSAVIGEHLSRAMATLPHDERRAMKLHSEGVPFRDIGAEHGKSTTWAFFLVKSAKEKLRRALAIHRLDEAA